MNTILKNGKIYQGEDKWTDILYIRDGVISAPFEDKNAEVIDLEGKTVIPGLIDSHLHMYNTGVSLRSVRLHGVTSIAECIRLGREYIEKNRPVAGSIVIGRGWNDDYFTDEHRMLNRHDLDKISTEHPVVYTRACGHALAANTKAIELAGVTASTPQVEGGSFELGEDGQPNGIFKEHAMELITRLSDQPDVAETEEILYAAMLHAAENGITSVQTNDMNEKNFQTIWQAYENLKKEGRALTRAYQQCHFSTPAGYEAFIKQGFKTGFGDDMNKIGPLKLLMDGSLGARTALMTKDYADAPGVRGIRCVTESDLDAFMKISAENDMQVAIHAIGDKAVDIVLSAYEKTLPKGKNPMRWGVVHCQITDDALIERFKKGDIHPMVQPIFIHYDMHITADRVGEELADTSYAFGKMDRLGLHISYGTDSPVEDLNTMNNIYCAVTRRDLTGQPSGGWHPEEAVSVERAIDNYTAGGAYNSFEEGKKGLLLPGYMADLAVLDRDIFTVPHEEIKDIKIDMTMVGGQVVFKR